MNGSYLVFYVPVVMVVMVVLETCKRDDPGTIVRRALRNSALLTAFLLAGAVALYLVQKYF